MKNAIILHGMPDKEHYLNGGILQQDSHWLPWLKQNLESNGIETSVPEIPHPYAPNYKAWCEVFEQFKINDETILIGHSAGGGFIIRYLAENNISVDRVILVAPWLDPDKYLKTMGCEDFFDFEFNGDIANKILNQVKSIDVLYSTDDDENILKTVEMLKQNFSENSNENNVINNAKINYHEFTDRGHFTTELGYNNDTLPEALEICLKS
ncbi:MAG: alpha/beta hydrolase [Candidatus Pacebacteria bacterium]|nr:alpha/beta hydrolase [Candidatus Paceibacterota bacterium]